MANEANDKQMDVAAVLRSARKAQKRTLASVSEEICVRSFFLEAIENRRFSDLPETTFAVGFARAYAKALKLDGAVIACQFKQELAAVFAASSNETDDSKRVDVSDTICATRETKNASSTIRDDKTFQIARAPKRRWPAWLSPVAGIVGAGMSWVLLGGQMTAVTNLAVLDSANEERILASLTPVVETGPKNDEGLIVQESPVSSQLDAPKFVEADVANTYASRSIFTPSVHASNHVPEGRKTNSIVLAASEDSWIQLSYSDGTELWSGVLRAGQTYQPELAGDVFLATSNAGGISLKRHGVSHGPLGERGGIVEALALKPSLFAKGTAASASSLQSVFGGND